MIIIDEQADHKLMQALRHLPDLEGKYGIKLHAVDGNREQARQSIIAQAQKHLPGADLYFCEDGEVFILAEASVKECRKTMLEIAVASDVQPAEKIGELYDLALQSGALLAVLEKKQDNRRKSEEMLRKLHAHEEVAAQMARKRQRILEQSARRSADDIAALRAARGEPVLMIIEDDPFSRRLVDNVLEKRFKLVSRESADDAIDIYAETAPDLLFLDINLPDVTGHELLDKIIALDPDSYVVMLSGNADRDNIMQAMRRGAKGFVAKPFSRDKLFQYIERCPTIGKKDA